MDEAEINALWERFKPSPANIKHYLFDIILLSVWRIVFFLWCVLALRDLIIRLHPLDIGADLVPPIGDNVVQVNAVLAVPVIVYEVYWFAVLGGCWWLAERILDKERSAHRKTHVELMPIAEKNFAQQNQHIQILEAAQKETQAELAKLKSKYAALQESNQSTIGELTNTQAHLQQWKAKANATKSELDQAQAATKEARVNQSKSDDQAKNAQAHAAYATLEVLAPAINSLTDLYKQQQAIAKAGDVGDADGDYAEAETVGVGSSNGHSRTPTPPPASEPKTNYFN